MRLPVLSDVYANASPGARGVALMLATTLIFTGMQVTVRHVAEDGGSLISDFCLICLL